MLQVIHLTFHLPLNYIVVFSEEVSTTEEKQSKKLTEFSCPKIYKEGQYNHILAYRR